MDETEAPISRQEKWTGSYLLGGQEVQLALFDKICQQNIFNVVLWTSCMHSLEIVKSSVMMELDAINLEIKQVLLRGLLSR